MITLTSSEKKDQLDVKVLNITTFNECEEDVRYGKNEVFLGIDDMNVDHENDCAGGITSTEEVTVNICDPVDVKRRQECEVKLPSSVNECGTNDEKTPSENDWVWGIRGYCKTHKSYGKY